MNIVAPVSLIALANHFRGTQILSRPEPAIRQVPANLPDGLSAILNPGNVKAVVEADAIDPLDLAARVPAAMPVLLTCSDADGQATCTDMKPLAKALAHTELQFVELSGVSHVLRDDPSDKISEYAKKAPLSPQLITALDEFVTR